MFLKSSVRRTLVRNLLVDLRITLKCTNFRELKKFAFREDLFSRNRPDSIINKSQMNLK